MRRMDIGTARDSARLLISRAATRRELELDLSRHRLDSLPPGIVGLRDLRVLRLNDNNLSSLPPEIGELRKLEVLHIRDNQLKALPEEIGCLRCLRELYAYHNELSSLPPQIGQLASLEYLHVAFNKLTSLPSSIQNLKTLETLHISNNRFVEFPPSIFKLSSLLQLSFGYCPQLSAIPPSVGELAQLVTLLLNDNQIQSLPREIGSLRKLETLFLQHNRLMSLPPELGMLANLKVLHVHGNSLKGLPPELGRLKLQDLKIEDNALPVPLRRVSERGSDAILTYLGSLVEESERLLEAKVMFVGEGQVGKTSLLAALIGERFLENRDTTHGLEVKALRLPEGPNGDEQLILHAWDFGGQEVYRVTHQLFFSKNAIYLLLWSPRMGAEQCDVEGWLKRIALRVGGQARVFIVATHCQSTDRIPRIDKDGLTQRFGELVAGFFEIDSKTGAGLRELKRRLTEEAAELSHTQMSINSKWKTARYAARDRCQAIMSFSDFAELCLSYGVDDQGSRTLAGIMHDLGDVLYYHEDDGLRDVIVFQPDWLTRAISYILEDRRTNETRGILEHHRLHEIWRDHGIEGRERFGADTHAFLHRLMEKYDVLFRLPDLDSSLVVQLVPHERPKLPWSTTDQVPDTMAQVSLVCKCNNVPPGLVAWMTVRTHCFSNRRLHWQRGMFLAHGDHGTALLELLDNEFIITVRAPWPNYFMSLLRFTLVKLIEERWPGLSFELSVPCPYARDPHIQCTGRFPLRSLSRLRNGSHSVMCLTCLNSTELERLLAGFRPAKEKQLHLGFTTIDTAGTASKSASDVMEFLTSNAIRSADCPRLFTIQPYVPEWNPAGLKETSVRLTLWCEYLDGPHPCCAVGSEEPGEYEIDSQWNDLGGLAAHGLEVVTILRRAIEAAPDREGSPPYESHYDRCLSIMNELLTYADEAAKDSGASDLALSYHKLFILLRHLDPSCTWGGLRKVRSPTGHLSWLCPTHSRAHDPGLIEIDREATDQALARRTTSLGTKHEG